MTVEILQEVIESLEIELNDAYQYVTTSYFEEDYCKDLSSSIYELRKLVKYFQ